MGIDINCLDCSFDGKQCFCYRRQLLDALRAYLKANQSCHQMEFKYINWFYRHDKEDKERVTDITNEEIATASELLRKNKLHGLFCWIFLTEESYISYIEAQQFLDTYSIIKDFMEGPCMDVSILRHAAYHKHNLQCW